MVSKRTPMYLLQFTPGVVDITPTRSFWIRLKAILQFFENAPKNDSLDEIENWEHG